MKKALKTLLLLTLVSAFAISAFACTGKPQDVQNEGTKLTAEQINEKLLPLYGEVPLTDNKEAMADFYEFDKEKPASYTIYSPQMNTMASELVIIEAKNEEDAKVFKTNMEARNEANVKTWERYLPDQYELVKNHYLEQKGKYVIYAIGENVEEVKKEFNNLVK